MIAPNTIVGRMPDARVRRVGDTQLVARSNIIMELNETGALIWKLADGKRSVLEISAGLQMEYDVTPDDARTDTLDFITELINARLLRVVE